MTQIDLQPMESIVQYINAGAFAPPTPKENKSPPLQVYVGKNKMPEIYSYIRGITPDDLSVRLEEFDRGVLRGVVPMWRKMARRDGHLLSVVEKRMSRISGLSWEITPADSSPEAKRQAEFLGEFLDEIPCFDQRREELAAAIAHKFAGHEIEWLPTGGMDGKLGCRLWPINTEDFDLSAGRPRLWVRNSLIELPPDKFLCHQLKVALMEPSSILYVLKMITAGQWVAFGEKFGMPGIIGTAPQSASQEDIDKFYEMLCNWAQEFVAAIREGYSVATLPASGANGTLTYPQMIEWADKENSKIWTGHTVTSQGESGTGTLAGEGAQDQLDALTSADARRLEHSLDEYLCEPAVRFQFDQPLLAHFHFKTERPVDRASEIETDMQLVDRGLKLPLAEVYTKYGWRQPEDGEEVLEGRPAPMPFNDPNPLTAFKADGLGGGVKARVNLLTDAFLPETRKALAEALEPLTSLVESAGEMSVEEFRAELLALKLNDSLVGPLAMLLRRSVELGEKDVINKARSALLSGGRS